MVDNIMLLHRFLGVWRLLPELCKYDVGQPPLRATYSFALSQMSPLIDVRIDWTDQQEKEFKVNYQIELERKKLEQHFGTNVQTLHELTAEGRLNSTTFDASGEKVLMRSSRELKEGDSRLEVVMETPTEKGVNRIFQIYEKTQ
jgi:hypothetical protein